MDLRITPQTTLANVLAQLGRQTNLLGKLQQQAATGKRLLTPSDDPVRLGVLLATKGNDGRLDSYLATIADSRSSLNVSVAAMLDAGSILTQARTIAVEAGQSTENAESRAAMANQVDRLIERIIEAANTQHAGQYLFAGADSRTRPFVTQVDNQGTMSVTYAGADLRNAAPISRQQLVATLYSGAEVFQQRERGPTVITGATGAAAGTGTDNAVTQGTLLVAHTATTFAAGSGVQAGTSSAAGDTILGPAGAHTLTIVDASGTGAFGTVALDGGPAVAFTNADNNLKVIGPHGEVVYVDTTAIVAGFNGTVDVAADGTLSVDGGASSVAIDFSANQTLTDSVTGAVTNIDSSNIRATGTDHIDYRGTYDVFQILIALRDDLRNTRGLSETDQLAGITQRIEELDRVHRGVLDAVGEQSASLENLDRVDLHLRDVQLTAKQLISDIEDADISQIIVQLQSNENALQLTLAIAARLQEQTLLDFLR